MEKDEYARALTEVYYVLQNSEEEIQDMIPEKFKKFITDNMEKEYVPTIDFNDENWDEHILEETQKILAIIYRDYIVNEEERKKILKEQEREERIIEQKLKEKYNPNNIFKNKNNINTEKNINVTEEKSIIKIDEKWYTKLFKIIKKVFGKA